MARSRMSRRRFLTMVAAASTAAATDAVAAKTSASPARKKSAAQTNKPKKAPVYATPPPPSAEIARGIAQQKEWLAGSLETLRRFELPPGSEQAFAFQPLAAKRRKT